ncbi:hypothetical protein FRB99_006374 [Tulasnella sp. 403]|nr:hypothetical protein FRB99_006374 [Tulasnella sp. 403]
MEATEGRYTPEREKLHDYVRFFGSIPAPAASFKSWRVRFEDNETHRVPLLLAAQLAEYVTRAPHGFLEPFVFYIWPSLDVYHPRFSGKLGVSDKEPSLPWDVLDLAAWAVVKLQPDTTNSATVGPLLTEIWDEYTRYVQEPQTIDTDRQPEVIGIGSRPTTDWLSQGMVDAVIEYFAGTARGNHNHWETNTVAGGIAAYRRAMESANREYEDASITSLCQEAHQLWQHHRELKLESNQITKEMAGAIGSG